MSAHPAWRAMRTGDIAAVKALSDAIYPPAYSERAEVYAGRLALYPEGCAVLADGAAIGGYLIAHPWAGAVPPALDTPLGPLPDAPDRLWLHDLALLPACRGTGAAAAAVARVTALAVGQAGGQGWPVWLVAVGDAAGPPTRGASLRA